MVSMDLFNLLLSYLQSSLIIPKINNGQNILLIFLWIRLLYLFHVELLLDDDPILDAFEVVFFHIFLHDINNGLEFFTLNVLKPLLLSNSVSSYLSWDFIFEQGLFVERAVEGANNISFG